VPDRFVLVETFKLGDLLMSSPVALALRRARPDAELVVLGPPGGRALPVWEGTGIEVEEVALPWQRLGWARDPAAVWRALGAVRRRFGRRFVDAVGLDPRGDLRHRALLAALGVRRTVGYRSEGPWRERWRGTTDRHVLDARARYLGQLGAALGLADAGPLPWPFRIRDEAEVDERLLVVAPEASNPLREWPSSRWAALAVEWRAAGWRVVLVEQHGGAVAGADREAFDHVWRGPLPELAALVARAAVVIAVDSLVGHLAGGQGTPVVTLVGPAAPGAVAPARPAHGGGDRRRVSMPALRPADVRTARFAVHGRDHARRRPRGRRARRAGASRAGADGAAGVVRARGLTR
jgi:ADP-heptose:LPS heptosyltransferase